MICSLHNRRIYASAVTVFGRLSIGPSRKPQWVSPAVWCVGNGLNVRSLLTYGKTRRNRLEWEIQLHLGKPSSMTAMKVSRIAQRFRGHYTPYSRSRTTRATRKRRRRSEICMFDVRERCEVSLPSAVFSLRPH